MESQRQQQRGSARVPNILIVDDDLAIRSLLTVMCRRMGYDCATAGDGESALEMLASHEYDAALLDLMMPRVDGFEVLSFLARQATRPAVIVITAAGAAAAARARTAGIVEAIVTKPFELHSLAKILKETLGKSPAPECGDCAPS